jgi:hypothetical protein
MVIPDQFLNWWENCLANPPITQGWVILIFKNLEGHQVDNILMNKMMFYHITTQNT